MHTIFDEKKNTMQEEISSQKSITIDLLEKIAIHNSYECILR